MPIVDTRCDYRLVHGQVAGLFLQQTGAKKIVILCDAIADDDFLVDTYDLITPADVPVVAYHVSEGFEKWSADDFGGGPYMLLFQNTKDCYDAWKSGIKMPTVNVGGSNAGPDKEGNERKAIPGQTIFLSHEEAQYLLEMSGAGVEVYTRPAANGAPATLPDKIKDL